MQFNCLTGFHQFILPLSEELRCVFWDQLPARGTLAVQHFILNKDTNGKTNLQNAEYAGKYL